MGVLEFYENRTVLLTGATGFVGKVTLEKILRDIPNVGRVVLIIRPNDEFSPKERFEEEIASSAIFDVLRSARPDFQTWIHNKVVALAGDMSKENLGLSAEDRKFVIDNVNIIIHCAASIDFRERLDKAIESNVLGTLRLFNMSKEMRDLISFVHCSTAYVNCNRHGVVEEKLPHLDFDPEEMVDYILKGCDDVSNIEPLTNALLAKYRYPNTYTFTKAVAECYINKIRGNIPIVFVRPTIVGASLKEPVPGWVDSIAAVGAAILYVGVGLVHFMKGNGQNIADIVPVDQVVNVMLLAAPAVSTNHLKIFHIGTSQANPCLWKQVAAYTTEYWSQHLPKKSITKHPSFMFHTNPWIYETHYFGVYQVPSILLSGFATLFGNDGHKRDAERFRRMIKAARLISETFQHFTAYEWIFSVSNTEQEFRELNSRDQDLFSCDTRLIQWQMYFNYFCFGLHKWVLKEPGVEPPTLLLNNNIILRDDVNVKNYIEWFCADLTWAATAYTNVPSLPAVPHTPADINTLVLESPAVRSMIQKMTQETGQNAAVIEKRAKAIMDRMGNNLKTYAVRIFAYMLKKIWRRIYHGIHVDEAGIEQMRAALQSAPCLLIPTHRSYLDFLLVSYICFEYSLPMPRIAAGEDFLAIILIRWLFRDCGAFFLRRTLDNDALYWTIFNEYVQRLVIDHLPVEFFIEGRRSRSGKTLNPKSGILSVGCTPFYERKVQDLNVIPISISYEKVLESELFSQEMMGGSKAKESLNGLLRASKVLRMNFGRINVVIAPPISLKQFSHAEAQKRIGGEAFNPFESLPDRKQVIHALGYHIIDILDKNIVITSTSIVSTIILMFRRGLQRDELISRSHYLREQIIAYGGRVAYEGPTDAMVDYALVLLSNLVTKRRTMYEPALSSAQNSTQSMGNPNHNYRKNILVLAFYRNQLLHLFQWDGIFACVLSGLTGLGPRGMKKKKSRKVPVTSGVKGKKLLEEVTFLTRLLSAEFVHMPHQLVEAKLPQQLESLVARGWLERHDIAEEDVQQVDGAPVPSGKHYYTITERGEGPITFLCHLFWPFVESYWVAAVTLFSIQPNSVIKTSLLQQKMTWLSEKMYDEGKIYFYESCNTEVLNNAITVFLEMGILRKKKVEPLVPKKRKPAKKPEPVVPEKKVEDSLQLNPPYDAKHGLLEEFVTRISVLRKAMPTQLPGDLSRALAEDFPILARL